MVVGLFCRVRKRFGGEANLCEVLSRSDSTIFDGARNFKRRRFEKFLCPVRSDRIWPLPFFGKKVKWHGAANFTWILYLPLSFLNTNR